ncbi:MAG TPA: SAM-dependent methyltransferase [Thermoanaerobaculia bacterium]|nr:SAM-dependent methyltransferase [Thermoanaerobaculia bacterium]
MPDWSHLDPVERSAAMTLSWRAAESRRNDRLFADPAAEEAAARLPPWPGSAESPLFADIVALRTLQLDEETAAALAAGIDQVVVLGAGLDTRFRRVPLPPGARAIAVDSAAVNALARTLLPADGRGERIDARLPGGLAEGLRRASFDPERATLWIAEGLLEYLPGRAWERLVAELSGHSAAGSRALITILGDALPVRFAHDPAFPFPRLPSIPQIVAAVPEGWRVAVVAARRLREVPPDAFAIMVMDRAEARAGRARD